MKGVSFKFRNAILVFFCYKHCFGDEKTIDIKNLINYNCERHKGKACEKDFARFFCGKRKIRKKSGIYAEENKL